MPGISLQAPIPTKIRIRRREIFKERGSKRITLWVPFLMIRNKSLGSGLKPAIGSWRPAPQNPHKEPLTA